MGAVADFVEDTVDFVGDAVGSVVDTAFDVVESVVDNVVAPIGEAVSNVVEAAMDDPIGTIAKVATAIVAPELLPLVSAADTVAHGGDLEDALKSAATTYVAQGVGQYVGNAADQLGAAAEYGTDVASQQTAMLAAQNAGMGTVGDVAGNIAGATAAGVVRGQDPLQALVSGGIGAGTSAVAAQIPGFSDLPPLAQTAVSRTVAAALSGGDPSQALVNAAINAGIAEARQQYNSPSDMGMGKIGAASGTFQPSSTYGDQTDASSVQADSGALPSGLQLAAADSGLATDSGQAFRAESSGMPIYADSKNADTVRPPFGYDLMPSEMNIGKPPAGAYYDATQNAWFMPNDDVSRLSEAIQNPEENPAKGALPSTAQTPSEETDSDVTTGGGFPSGGQGAGSSGEGVTGALPSETTKSTASGALGYGSTSALPSESSGDGNEIVVTAPRETEQGKEASENPEQPETNPITSNPAGSTSSGSTSSASSGALPSGPSSNPAKTSAATSSTASIPEFKWLDTSPQMIKAAAVQQNPAHMAQLKQLYGSLTPELRSVLAERGVAEPQEQTPGLGDGFASGGSAQSVMDSLTAKFSKAPTVLEAAPVIQQQQPRISGLKHIYDSLRSRQAAPAMARGGLPSKYQEAAPEGHKPEFVTGLTGYYASGDGTGQSDDIPAMLHDGDYVMDADAVAALGDGSSKAGAQALAKLQAQIPHRDGGPITGKPVPARIADGEYVFPAAFVAALGGGDNKRGSQMLDSMREALRAHKRSAPTSKIPPKAKSPLDYLRMAKG